MRLAVVLLCAASFAWRGETEPDPARVNEVHTAFQDFRRAQRAFDDATKRMSEWRRTAAL